MPLKSITLPYSCKSLSNFQKQHKKFYITVSDGGNLGDLISKYASLYAYSKLSQNAFVPLLPRTTYRSLKMKLFPYFSMKTYNSETCDKMFNWINGSVRHKYMFNSERSPARKNTNISNINSNDR